MNGSYSTAGEPSRDRKFADSLKVLQKEAGVSLICVDESYLTCLLWAQIPENAYFYARPNDDALKEANSSRKRGLRGEQFRTDRKDLNSNKTKTNTRCRSPLLDFGFVKTGVFRGKLRHWMVNVVKNRSLDTS